MKNLDQGDSERWRILERRYGCLGGLVALVGGALAVILFSISGGCPNQGGLQGTGRSLPGLLWPAGDTAPTVSPLDASTPTKESRNTELANRVALTPLPGLETKPLADQPTTTPTSVPARQDTPTPSPRPTQPPSFTRTTRPSIIVGMTGQYTIGRNGDLWTINVSFRPTRQENVNLKINDLELTLIDQNPPLPNNPKDAVTNINGLGSSHPDNWKCEVVKSDNGNRVVCQGKTALALNSDSTLVVSFEQPVQQVNPLYLHFSSDGKVVGSMNPIAR